MKLQNIVTRLLVISALTVVIFTIVSYVAFVAYFRVSVQLADTERETRNACDLYFILPKGATQENYPIKCAKLGNYDPIYQGNRDM